MFRRSAVERFPALTFSNLVRYPSGLATLLTLLGIGIILVCVVPNIDDKPLIAHQQSVWRGFQQQYLSGYRVHLDRLVFDDKNLPLLTKMYRLWIISLRNDHQFWSLFFRHPGSGYSDKQRIATLLMRLLTIMAVNGIFYGSSDASIGGMVVFLAVF